MTSFRSVAALLLAALVTLPANAADARTPRVLEWSGYRWTVRHSTKPENPGKNLWGDSRAHVRVQRDGRLRLNIVGGRSAEVVGPRTGYGRYTWVVDSDMSTANAFRVVALFVRGTNAEQDIEFCRWGEPESGAAGTWVSWEKDRIRRGFEPFIVTPTPPYKVQIDLRRRSTRFGVRDGAGAVLLDRTFRTPPAGRHIAPRVSYWLYPGHPQHLNPYTIADVHPPVIVRSFKYRRARR